MRPDCSEHGVELLKRQLEAWNTHLNKFGLDDRQRFIEWLSKTLGNKEFALLIDGEVERGSLWRIYLNERYGS
jgi:hypothetical protein